MEGQCKVGGDHFEMGSVRGSAFALHWTPEDQGEAQIRKRQVTTEELSAVDTQPQRPVTSTSDDLILYWTLNVMQYEIRFS